MGLGLIQDKLKPFPSELLDHLHKCIGRERIMLGRDTEPGLFRLIQNKTVFQKAHFLDHLSRISQEFHPFFRQGDPAAASCENLEAHFPFGLLQCG